MLETILDQKLNIGNAFIYQINKRRMAKAREQHALNMRDQRSEAKKSGFDSRFDEIHQSYRNNKKGQ